MYTGGLRIEETTALPLLKASLVLAIPKAEEIITAYIKVKALLRCLCVVSVFANGAGSNAPRERA